VSSIRANLIFGILLENVGIEVEFKFDKIVSNNVFVKRNILL